MTQNNAGMARSETMEVVFTTDDFDVTVDFEHAYEYLIVRVDADAITDLGAARRLRFRVNDNYIADPYGTRLNIATPNDPIHMVIPIGFFRAVRFNLDVAPAATATLQVWAQNRLSELAHNEETLRQLTI